jgi:hypothetical protein
VTEEMDTFIGAVRRYRYALRNGGNSEYVSDCRYVARLGARALGYRGEAFNWDDHLIEVVYSILALNPSASNEQIAAAIEAARIPLGVR